MATLGLILPQLVNDSIPGVQPQQRGGAMDPTFIEAASQTYRVNDLIYVDTSGNTAICTVNGSVQLDGEIAGLASSAATGTTGATANLHVIRANDVVLMNVYHATPASAVGTQAMVGDVFAIIKPVATGKWHVDITNAVEGATDALARVRCIGFETNKAIDSTGTWITPALTDIYALMKVHFLPLSAASDSDPFQKRILQFA